MIREIVVQGPDGSRRKLALEGAPVSVGRSHENELFYPDDASLSRKHLVIEKTTGEWVVRDLGSKNGTLVNGVRLQGPHVLHGGDRIEAGQVVLRCGRSVADLTSGVVFIPSDPSAGTIMTSLDKVLSENRMPISGAPTPEPGRPTISFDHPALVALIRAGRELSGNKPLSELFPLILELSIQAVSAERGALMTLEGNDLVVRAVRGEGLKISTTVRDKVLQEKTSLLVRDTLTDEAYRGRQSIHDQHVRSMMAVPLQTEDRVIGLVYVDSRYFVRELTPDDLSLLTVLANVAATRIEHQRLAEVEQMERLYARDLQQAAEIQRRLLPEKAPTVAGMDLAGYNAACRTVGGDYYDFFPYPDGSVAVVLGDVAGKGMPAALMMSSLQARVQVLAEDPGDLAHLMSRLDRIVAASCPNNRFITLFFCLLEPSTGRLRYCNAGHNPPLLVRSTARAPAEAPGADEPCQTERLEGGGTILGILPQLGYEERECRLEPGDLLALYSDGITEASNPEGEEFGEERLGGIVASRAGEPASAIVAAVVRAVAEWTGDAPPADDITLVVARRTR